MAIGGNCLRSCTAIQSHRKRSPELAFCNRLSHDVPHRVLWQLSSPTGSDSIHLGDRNQCPGAKCFLRVRQEHSYLLVRININISKYSYAVAPAVVNPVLERRILNALASVKCNGQAAFYLAGCVYNGTMCSNRGNCSSGVCICNAGFKVRRFSCPEVFQKQ